MSAEAGPPDPSVDGIKRYADHHDPFWPRVDLDTLRARLALHASVSDAQLHLAACSAAITAAQEFAEWRRALRARGFKRLDDLAGHATGRALSRCYLQYLERATRRALCVVSHPGRNRAEVSHG
ncbi:head completion/stabilization protein [Pseudomonas phoenicis]|uniref:head completion/stabilization protein n=1 Tax=unclassified Pseudomonas TaxID=196821 RepID=UPI0039A26989